MWLSLREEADQAWFPLEPLTLLYPYQAIQKKIIKTFSSYRSIVECYSESAKRPIYPITEEYIEKKPEVAEQNVALLKNAIELWRTATRTSDAIAPILSHYSWHCFNSFLIYSFFRWEPQHSESHGINIKLSDNLNGIRIQILKKGLFRRLVDTWTIIGCSLVLSPLIPIIKNGQMQFVSNNKYLLHETSELSLRQLLKFDPNEFEIELHSNEGWKKTLRCPFLANSVSLPNRFLKSYLILFVASSIARYRPILWHSILTGKGEKESDFYLNSSESVLNYTLGENRGLSFVSQVERILRNIEQGTFVLLKPDGSPLTSL